MILTPPPGLGDAGNRDRRGAAGSVEGKFLRDRHCVGTGRAAQSSKCERQQLFIVELGSDGAQRIGGGAAYLRRGGKGRRGAECGALVDIDGDGDSRPGRRFRRELDEARTAFPDRKHGTKRRRIAHVFQSGASPCPSSQRSSPPILAWTRTWLNAAGAGSRVVTRSPLRPM